MHKKILLVIFLIFFTLISFAQKKNFDAGVFLGFNGIHIEGDNQVLYNSSNGTIWGTGGISAGLSVKRYFHKNYYWAFEMRYIRKGSIYEFINNQGVRDFESIKLDYAELPVLIAFKTSLGRRYIYIELGGAVAKLLNSQKIVSDYSFGQDISLFDMFRDYDYSAVGSVKISTNRKEKILLGVRVSRSFRSIHKVYKLYNFDYGVEISYNF